MQNAGDLFEYAAKAPSSNPTTSLEAAKSVEKDVTRMCRRVLEHIKARPGTCEEVELSLGLPHQTASARIRQLVLDKRLEDSGDKRPTSSGRRAIVWRAI